MGELSYLKPKRIDEALRHAKLHPDDCAFLGGGTDITVYRKQELSTQSHIIDLSEIPQLRSIEATGNSLRIGATVTLDELISSRDTYEFCPMITEAARSVATPVIRQSATVGGNLLVANRCTFYNQSQTWRESVGSCLRDVGDTCLVTKGRDKCYSRNVSDLAPAFIALGATIAIQAGNDPESIPLERLYTGDGIRIHAHTGSAGILTVVSIVQRPSKWFFRKLRRRQSLDFTSLTVAATMTADDHARICLNGVSMSPILLEVDLSATELPELQKQARRACKTVDNDLLPLKYRREMMDVYLAEFYMMAKRN